MHDEFVYRQCRGSCFRYGFGHSLRAGAGTRIKYSRPAGTYDIIYIVLGLEEAVAVNFQFGLIDDVLRMGVAGHARH